MDLRQNKLEISIVLLAVVAMFGLFRVFGSFSPSNSIFGKDISYEMPRPKNDIVGEFGLNGREIERQYVNPFEKKAAADAAAAKAKAEAELKAKQVVKKALEKKAATTTAAKEKKKPGVDVSVVEKDAKSGTPGMDSAGTDSSYANNAPVGLADAEKKADDKKDEKMTDAQWRALLASQPTRENMDKLVKAFAAGDVQAGTFYSIIEEMLKSPSTEEQSIALYGLERMPSIRSFTMVASSLETLPEGVQPAAKEYLLGYAKSPKHGILEQALESDDLNVAIKAAEVVRDGVQNAQNGGGLDPRDVRGENQANSLNSFSRFIPIFEAWAQSGEPQLQNLASTILPMLPTNQASL